jgi:hypothetical protein
VKVFFSETGLKVVKIPERLEAIYTAEVNLNPVKVKFSVLCVPGRSLRGV